MTDQYDDELYTVNPVTGEAFETPAMRAKQVGVELMAALGQWDANRERSRQAEKRILGPSSVGGCREFIRATIVGDPMKMPLDKEGNPRINLPAIWGTVDGDTIEAAYLAAHPEMSKTQFDAEYTLTVAGAPIKVKGHGDVIMDRKRLVDLKSKDGLGEVRWKGASVSNCIQISIYLLAKIADGSLDPDAEAFLAYFDRSGSERGMEVIPITRAQAEDWVAVGEQRLEDVQKAIATGQSQVHRDEPEPWCYHTGCPFYQACWPAGEYRPTGLITEERALEAMEDYSKGRRMKKDAEDLITAAKRVLNPDPNDIDKLVRGRNAKGDTIDWKISEKQGTVFTSIDMREA